MNPIVQVISIFMPFATVFGIVYIIYTTRHRERMNMIDKGMDPQLAKPTPDPLRSMRNGLLLIGIGIGLAVGWLFHQHGMDPSRDTALPYLVGTAIFAGLALVYYYVKFGGKASEG
jgi:hypothetical protein